MRAPACAVRTDEWLAFLRDNVSLSSQSGLSLVPSETLEEPRSVYRRRGFFLWDLCAPVIIAFHPSFSALSRSSTTPPKGPGSQLDSAGGENHARFLQRSLEPCRALLIGYSRAGLELTKEGMAHASARRETVRSPPE
jgi:hypothetical protein